MSGRLVCPAGLTAMLLIAAAASGLAASENVTVVTSLGPVVGTAGNNGSAHCASFYGVRYAAAPTGANRFRPPQPATPWTEPQPAKHVGKSCLQTFGDAFINFPLWLEYLAEKLHLGMEPMDEDCLFLNVFSPRLPDGAGGAQAELLPVMVWFHGGSNMGGSGDLQSEIPLYDGQVLCATGDPAVIVTVNYR
jgi:para-nitrobenzyl esterase